MEFKKIAALYYENHKKHIKVKSKGVPRQAEVALGVPTFAHYKGGRSSAVSTGRLYPMRNPWYSFSEAESTSGHMGLSEGTTEKNPQ